MVIKMNISVLMSVYKKEKANRKKIVAQERAKRTASVICGWSASHAPY